MGVITASSIISKARNQLQDTITDDDGQYRWDNDVLLGYLNEGQRAVVALRPEASMTTGSVLLVAGTKQDLPTGGLSLIDVNRNMGAAGTTPGRTIQRISGEELDLYDPDWHLATAGVAVKHFVYNPEVPKVFYVYPPQTASPEYIEMSYSTPPADVANIGTVISIDDIFEPALLQYLLYMAFSQDAPIGDMTKGGAHMNTFIGLLTGQIEQDERVKR